MGFLVVVCFSFPTRADLKDSATDHRNRHTLAMYLKPTTFFGWEEWVMVVPVVKARHSQQAVPVVKARHSQQAVITSEW